MTQKTVQHWTCDHCGAETCTIEHLLTDEHEGWIHVKDRWYNFDFCSEECLILWAFERVGPNRKEALFARLGLEMKGDV